MLNMIIENRIIESLAGQFAHSPQQLNYRHETDAEIVRLSDGCTLAITTDSIAEEIAAGLYTDPCLIGWMTVMVNLSDLAAVGAQPVGLVISEILTHSCTDGFLAGLHKGIRDACHACGTFVLGGDINHGDRLILTGTAIGTCLNGEFLSRIGSRPGDLLFASNKLGRGNAFALSALSGSFGMPRFIHDAEEIDALFQPCARLKEGQALCGLATSCMDTSDGVIATLDQIMRLNHVGFAFDTDWSASLDLWARRIAQEAAIPEWLLLAGQHGEFELLFTVSPERIDELMLRADENHFEPVLLGEVKSEQGITLPMEAGTIQLDTAHIRNCADGAYGNIQRYLQELLRMDREIREGVINHASNRNL
jgi:thiamine-monophosphate kinase